MLTPNIFSFGDWGATLLDRITQQATLMITLATQSTIDVSATNYHLLVLVGVSECKKCLFAVGTSDTQGIKFLHSVCHRNALQDFSEGSAVEVPIQTHQKDVLAKDVHRKPNKVH